MDDIITNTANVEKIFNTIKSTYTKDIFVLTDEQRESFVSAVNYINNYPYDKNSNNCFIVYGKKEEGISNVLSSIGKYYRTMIGKNVYFLGNEEKYKEYTDSYTERIDDINKVFQLDYNKSIFIIDDLEYLLSLEERFRISILYTCIPTIIGTMY